MKSNTQTLMPDFLVIGAGKSGTTSLHEYLSQHPQIFMAKKEPNFFAYETVDPESIKDLDERQHYYDSYYRIEDYQNLYQTAVNGQLKGEVSNTYMSKDHSCDNIKRHVPNAKLIAILRHPGDRLYSRFTHLKREGSELAKDYNDFFKKDTIWWTRTDMIPEGFYYKRLKPFYDNFPSENIRIYLYEDFIGKTDEVVRDIFEFLQVDSSVKVGTNVVYNKSGNIKSKTLNKLVGQNSAPIIMLKKALPRMHKMLKRNTRVNAILNSVRSKNLTKPGFPSHLRNKLIDEVYGKDIEKLQSLIGKDLKHWLN